MEGNTGTAEIVKSGSCGAEGENLTWTLDSNGLLVIEGIGEMADDNSHLFWEIQKDIKEIKIKEGVTSIGYNAFYSCTNLTKVTLPETMITIGERAFNECSVLEKINLPLNVTSIGPWAFRKCSALESITLPENITSIADRTFYECTSLKEICIPAKVESIGYSAFLDCTGLETVTFPESVKEIKDYAFQNCTSLTGVLLPENIFSIGQEAFAGCSSLKSIVLPKNLDLYAGIGWGAFSPDLHFTVYIGTYGEFYANDYLNASNVTLLCTQQHNLELEKFPATFEMAGGNRQRCTNKGWNLTGERELQCDYCEDVEYTIPQVSSDVLSETEYVYTGKVIQPEVTVKDMEENPLTKDEDYTVSYSNANSTNPGEYMLTVTLRGENYAGTLETSYKITKVPQTDFAIKEVGEKTYGDKAFELEAEGGQTGGDITWSVTGDEGVLELNATKGEKVTAAILGAGTVTVTAQKAGDEHYADVTATKEITVAPKPVTIKAKNKSVEQDDAMPEFTYTISGLINEDTVTSAPVFVCWKDGSIITDTKTPGEFEIVPTKAVITNPNNYQITYINGTLTVNAHIWNKSYTTDKPATCVTEGKRSIRCTNPGCNAVKPESETTIPAKGHLWDEGVITKAPTCTEPGIRTCTCERCKWTIQKEVAPTGHTYAGEITKATFTKDGVVSGVCEDCGVSVQREVIPQVSKVELSHTEYTYNGTNRQPKVILKDRTGKELKPEEYSVAYPKESKVPDTYELTITLKGNYYEGTLTKAYTVKKGNQVIGLSDMTKRIDSKTVTLKAEILQGNKTGRFGYKSSNPEVASVTSWGRVTFHKVGKVEITAMTRGSANYNSAQKTITLTVVPAPTAITKLQSQNPGWLNIQYRANPDADGYQMQYGTSSDMKGAKYAAVENAAIRSYTRTDVKSGETYYVRVRTYNVVDGERIYSNWSGIKSVEVK